MGGSPDHHPVYLDLSVELALRRIGSERPRYVRSAVDVVRIEGFERLHAVLAEPVEQFTGYLVIRVRDDLPGFRVHDVQAEILAERVVVHDLERVEPRLRHPVDVSRSDSSAGFYQHRTFLVLDVERRDIAAQTFRDKLESQSVRRQLE